MYNRPDPNFNAPVMVPQSGLPAHPRMEQEGYYGVNLTEDQGGTSFDPLKLMWYVVHYRWLLAAFLLAGLVIGFGFSKLQVPLYRSTVILEHLTSSAKVFREFEVTSESRLHQRVALETTLNKLKSRNLARRVVYKLNLSEKPAFYLDRSNFSPIRILKRAFGLKNNFSNKNLNAEQREIRAIRTLRKGLTVILIRKTALISIVFSHPEKKFTDVVANEVVSSFITLNLDQSTETSDQVRIFIREQVEQSKQKLQISEVLLNDYAKLQGITITGDDSSLISSSLVTINNALSEAVQQKLESERLLSQINAGNATSLPSVLSSEAILATKTKIAELRATYQEKLGTLKPGFPEMKRLQAQINELRRQIGQEVRVISNSIKIKYEQSVQKENDLKTELSKLEIEQLNFQEKNIQYTILKREVDSNRTQYDSLIKKLNEVGVGSEIRDKKAAVVDPALRPERPYSPRLFLNLLASLGIFALLAAAVIYIIELLNNTFSTPDQVENELKLPILGIIPYLEESEIDQALGDERSAISEAYRSLRTSIQFTGTDGYVKSLMVTSAEPSEGKSTTVFKLAHDFATLGLSVLVIDGDMRKPKIHRLFGTDNAIGLSNLLTNVVKKGDVLDIFKKTSHPNITLLTAGTVPPNPADLLSSQKMGMTISLCSKKYDMVIIDSPPVMGLSDAPIIARNTESALFVVATKGSTRKSIQNAIRRLKAGGANVIGVVMSRFSIDKLDYNYAYRYMQYDYYSSEEEKPRLETTHVQTKNSELGQDNESNMLFAFLNRFRRRSAQ